MGQSRNKQFSVIRKLFIGGPTYNYTDLSPLHQENRPIMGSDGLLGYVLVTILI